MGDDVPQVSGRHLLASLGVWVGSSVLAGVITYVATRRLGINTTSAIIAFEVYLLLIVAIVMCTGGVRAARHGFGIFQLRRWQLAVTIKAALLMVTVVVVWFSVVWLIKGTLAEEREQLLFVGLDGGRLVGAGPVLVTLSVLRGVLITPIAEELFFRGAFYSWLKGRFTVRAAIITSAALFTVVHFGVLALLPYVAIFGLIGAWVRERTGSIVPWTIVHCVHNAAIFVAAYVITGWKP